MNDFFISYNSADRLWAEWIAWILEEQGYRVMIQAWDIRPGSNFILDMQRAAEDSQRTIMVLSENYLKASYTQPEWAAAFKLDPESKERRLIPIRVAACKPTGLLGPLVYVDLVDKSETDAEQAVLVALKDRAKPATRPSFPGKTPVDHRVMPQRVSFPGKNTRQQTERQATDPDAINHDDIDPVVTDNQETPAPLMNTPKPPLTPRERLALSRTITGLTVQEFNDLLLLLNPPAGLIPPPSTQQGDRVYALLTWAQSTTGCSLGVVQDALHEITSP